MGPKEEEEKEGVKPKKGCARLCCTSLDSDGQWLHMEGCAALDGAERQIVRLKLPWIALLDNGYSTEGGLRVLDSIAGLRWMVLDGVRWRCIALEDIDGYTRTGLGYAGGWTEHDYTAQDLEHAGLRLGRLCTGLVVAVALNWAMQSCWALGWWLRVQWTSLHEAVQGYTGARTGAAKLEWWLHRSRG
ncbi:hypothetical protein Acr_15g0004850 [Actinidia rufa]|uniref:Uncharacterized protein n=1 Tax=Actinidia rufa TaxID=165716 RepID=A0A7J0FT37_9ERIC|nr:hypothetical protein Acr_15g0004850 [Actinidia rufa]